MGVESETVSGFKARRTTCRGLDLSAFYSTLNSHLDFSCFPRMAPRRTARPIDPSLLPPPPDTYSQQHQSNDGPPSRQQPPPPSTSSTPGYGAGQHFDPSSSQPHYGQQDPAYYQQSQQQPQQQAEYYSSPPPPPSTHIPQPPHTSGRQFKGPRSKIEAEQVPSPVVLWEQEKEIYDREGEHFVAAREMNGVVPSSATDYRAVDEGEQKSLLVECIAICSRVGRRSERARSDANKRRPNEGRGKKGRAKGGGGGLLSSTTHRSSFLLVSFSSSQASPLNAFSICRDVVFSLFKNPYESPSLSIIALLSSKSS